MIFSDQETPIIEQAIAYNKFLTLNTIKMAQGYVNTSIAEKVSKMLDDAGIIGIGSVKYVVDGIPIMSYAYYDKYKYFGYESDEEDFLDLFDPELNDELPEESQGLPIERVPSAVTTIMDQEICFGLKVKDLIRVPYFADVAKGRRAGRPLSISFSWEHRANSYFAPADDNG